MKTFLSVREVSEVLSMKEATVYAKIRLGEIPGYKLGGCIRVAEDDLERYVESRKIRPTKSRALSVLHEEHRKLRDYSRG